MATIASMIVEIGADVSSLRRGLNQGAGMVDDFAGKADRIGQNMQSIGTRMSLGVTLPILGAGAASLKMAGDFEASMNMVGAVTGGTAEQMAEMEAVAKELGASTQFSASQAGEAMYFLASAGFDTQQTMETLPGVLQLASAAQMDLGRAADIASNILSGYGMEAEELGRVNDVLVKTFQRTNTNVEMLGEAFKYAAPVAKAAGLDFEEVSAAIGLMGNAGIQASMAGTSLRGALSRLLNQTPQVEGAIADLGISLTDTEGNVLPLVEIIRRLEESGADAGAMMTIFGQRAGPAFAALVEQGSDAMAALTADLQDAGGTAEAVADVQMSGLNGAMKELKSALEAVGIAIAQSGLLEGVTSFAKGAASLFRWLSEANPAILKAGVVVAGLVAAVGPLLVVFGTLLTMVPLITAGFTALGGAAGIMAIVTPVGLAVAAFTALVAAGFALVDNWGVIKYEVGRLVDGIRDALVGRFNAIVESVRAKVEAVKGFFSGLYQAVVGGSYVPDMVDGIERQFNRLDTVMVNSARTATTDTAAAYRDMAVEIEHSMWRVERASGRLPTNFAAPGMVSAMGGGRGGLPAGPGQEARDLIQAAQSLGYLFQDLPQNMQTAIQEGLAAEEAVRASYAAAQPGAGGGMLGGVLDSVVGGLKSVGASLLAALNPLNIFLTIMDEVARSLAPSFDALAEPLGLLAQVVADAVAPLLDAFVPVLEAIVPVVQELLDVLMPIVMAFMPVIQALVPLFAALMPIVRLVAIALTYLAEIIGRIAAPILDVVGWLVKGIGKAIEAIGRAIDKIPFMSDLGLVAAGQAAQGVGEGMQGMADSMREMADGMAEARRILQDPDGTNDALGGLGDAARETTAALRNVPQGYRIALARFEATQPGGPGTTTTTSTPTAPPPPPPGGRGRGGPGVTQVEVQAGAIVVEAGDRDASVLASEIVGELQRRALARYGDPTRWAEVD